MTQKETRGEFKLIPIIFSLLTFLMIVGGASALTPNGEEGTQSVTGSTVETAEDMTESSSKIVNEASSTVLPQKRSSAPVATNPWHNYPNVCETFTVLEGEKLVKTKKGKKYPVRYRRNRYNRKRSDQRRTRDLIKLVVKEMGGDDDAQRIVSMIAMHESSWNPEAIHILNGDLEANSDAWARHNYSRSEELQIESTMAQTSAKSKKFWSLKAQLSDIRLYKGNPHWNDQLEYTYRVPEREHRGEVIPGSEWQDHHSVWSFGYGLFGMNAVLFTHLWDREAPPWILCGDEGIEATVAAVWALRNAQSECDNLAKQNPKRWGSEGGTAYGIVRRFARGQCSDKRLGPVWRKLMADLDTVDWSSRPDFGEKFGRYERHMRGGKWRWTRDKNRKRVKADREAILAHMLKKAEEKGLLRENPLERKNPDSEPVVVAQNGGGGGISAP